MPAPLALLPHTIQTTLQTQPDLDATLLHSMANGLLQTIANHEANTAVTKKGYKDRLHHLEQHICHRRDDEPLDLKRLKQLSRLIALEMRGDMWKKP
jgi:hypothetical protein